MTETPKCPYCGEEMSDLIERKEAIEAIKKYGKDEISAGRKHIDPVDDIVELCNMLDALPAVEAAPVVHGEWIKRNKYDMESRLYCSSCKKEYDYIDGICYIVSGSELPFYCPNCGAKMDG